MDEILFKRLLRAGESAELDYKSEQYAISNATDNQKAELIKDILAFANSWRASDAYILIGVKENSGLGETVGVVDHLNDAVVQQLVNSKTNRPITFSCAVFVVDGKEVDVIQISVQERPRFLRKAYGGLIENTIYIRRGSSTAIALPDEIAEMGFADSTKNQITSVDFELGEKSSGQAFGHSVTFTRGNLAFPNSDAIPLLPDSHTHPLLVGGTFDHVNPDFYRECAVYFTQHRLAAEIQFRFANLGSVVLMNPKLKITYQTHGTFHCLRNGLPPFPKRKQSLINGISMISNKHWKTLIKLGTKEIIVDLPNIQPKDEEWSEPFYVGFDKSIVWQIECRFFADNLPNPVHRQFTLNFDVTQIPLSFDDLKKHLDEFEDDESLELNDD
jgi:Putative DNA-binding domain